MFFDWAMQCRRSKADQDFRITVDGLREGSALTLWLVFYVMVLTVMVVPGQKNLPGQPPAMLCWVGSFGTAFIVLVCQWLKYRVVIATRKHVSLVLVLANLWMAVPIFGLLLAAANIVDCRLNEPSMIRYSLWVCALMISGSCFRWVCEREMAQRPPTADRGGDSRSDLWSFLTVLVSLLVGTWNSDVSLLVIFIAFATYLFRLVDAPAT